MFNFKMDTSSIRKSWQVYFYTLLILVLAMKSYFYHYETPDSMIWDEVYHIASAEKYLQNKMFMEPHPPLGKMLIAWGEAIMDENKHIDKSSFLKTDSIKELPRNYSFIGVRLFPVLASVLCAVIFFLILLNLSSSPLLSFCFSLLFIYENSFIVHSRAAMLESVQILFLFLAILYFFKKLDLQSKIPIFSYSCLGIFVGLAAAVKLNSLFILLLFVFWFLRDEKDNISNFIKSKDKSILYQFCKNLALKVTASCIPITLTFFAVFYLHFYLGQSLIEGRTYKASGAYKEIISEQKNTSLANFGIMMADNYQYMKDYQKGVPKFKRYSEFENGSLPTDWPFGGKTIAYQREKKGAGNGQYLYLMGNPIVWWIGLTGLIMTFIMISAKLFFNIKIHSQKHFYKLIVLFSLYLGYMIPMINIERVMYLYHYFIPLFLSLIMAYLTLLYFYEGKLKEKNKIVLCSTVAILIQVIVCFKFFSPLTYKNEISTENFTRRMWLETWRLQNAK